MPTSSKTVSVIITCYNYAQYLPECIESVMEQSYPPHEIIVVSDGSSDNSVQVALEYPVVVISKENGGLASARNRGIEEATGEYIMCLDADDILRKDALLEHMKLADESSVVNCGLTWFGAETGTWRPQGATLETLLRTNSVFCNAVFPKKAWEKVKFDESDTIRLGLEDWLMWIELAIHGYKFKTNNYIALLYRKHGTNMTKQTTHPRWNDIIGYMKDKIKEKYGLDTHFYPRNPSDQ